MTIKYERKHIIGAAIKDTENVHVKNLRDGEVRIMPANERISGAHQASHGDAWHGDACDLGQRREGGDDHPAS